MSNPAVSVQIAELNSANATPEVVVSFYTGGAHCCSDTTVLTQAKDRSSWQAVELGELDGGPLIAADLDGDGRYEFETRERPGRSCWPITTALPIGASMCAEQDRRVPGQTQRLTFPDALERMLKESGYSVEK
jgi:hypothetical protein